MKARREIVREGEIGIYHCWSRCVQRAQLCGYDHVTGMNFDYRRGWIEALIEYQASIFAVDVGSYNVLSNHMHLIVRTRPDIAEAWSDEEVAWRWKQAWPLLKNGRWVSQPQTEAVKELLGDAGKLKHAREGLSSLSWFLARTKEPIARICNAEVDTTGHFWQARFRSRELLDEEAVLTCSIYVDLNQIKAGMCESLEESRFSSIRRRVQAARAREVDASIAKAESLGYRGTEVEQSISDLFADCWLAPISDQPPPSTPAPATVNEPNEDASASTTPPATTETDESAGAAPTESPAAVTSQPKKKSKRKLPGRPPKRRPRASDDPILGMPTEQYLQIVTALAELWLAQQEAPAHPPPDLGPQVTVALESRGINPTSWVQATAELDQWCYDRLGRADSLAARAQAIQRLWFKGTRTCRDIFT